MSFAYGPLRPGFRFPNGLFITTHTYRASVKLLEFGVRTPGGLFLGVWYAGGIDFWRFRTPNLPIFGVILGLLESKR